ncbi:TetR/AcrR family transcriptional regulator [Planosporangium flavigriseum]|uniref:TetR family transcriptional regulator n=1 Tax=Planosporangium flavigriseum TaxID=373681 RepID=A0A8J3LTR5_9ACTN|nr:TetR/AcrR family transcriptional regulator [Planosporangium flavigriseum]NJC67975.1 TetR/AcrR family transcriptional regulator [Planosporangium flavigriseum]GIG76625.1 TetR family transcriptional regulator [Planosporangium flavigriseum]
MTSSCNKPSGLNKQGSRTEEDALLDAARAGVLAVGLRRTTLTDVARRAGVSRMTIYRRWPDMTALVGDLMTREWGTLTQTAMAVAAGEDGAAGGGNSARQRLVAAIVAAARALRQHPVFRRIVELDPEILLPYLVDRRGRSQDQMLAMVTAAIAAGAADGSIRAGDPALLARGVLLAAQGFVVSLRTMTDGFDEDDLDGQLRLLLDRYLVP